MATIEPNFENICINPNDDLVLYKKEIVRSRIEKFLYAICSLDTDDLPTPLSRIEELYNCLVTGEDIPTFTPLSRAEKFVMAMLGAYDVELLPTPISRSETLMKKIATGDNNLDDVDILQSRYEFLLAYIIKAGGFNGGNGDFYYKLTSLTSGFTTIYDTLDMPVKSAILKGNTLVNLGGTYNKTDTPTWFTVFITQQKVKQSNVYYAIINNTGDGLMRLRYSTSDTVIKAVNPMSCEKFIFTATESDYLRIKNSDTISNCNGTFLLLEYQDGMENWDIPYFEGMTSVKIPVLTTVGKNLFDSEFKLSTYSSGKIIIPNGIISSVSFPHTTTSNRRGIACVIQVKPNTNYTISIVDKQENTVLLGDGYNNLNDISSQTKSVLHVGSVDNANHTTLSFTTPSNCNYMIIGCYIKYSYAQSGGTITFNEPPKIQLEENSVSTTYEPYKSTTVSCNEDVELRRIGDIKDELNLVTGELTQYVGAITIDDSHSWKLNTGMNGEQETHLVFQSNYIFSDYKYVASNLNITNNKFSLVGFGGNANKAGEWLTIGSNGLLYVKINKNKLDTHDIDGFKKWLVQNPIIIQYELTTKSIKTVDLSTRDQDGKETELSTFDNTTHVITSSEGLIPTGDIDIARPIQFVDYSLDNGWTTLYNTIDYPVKNTVLRGQTLVNIIKNPTDENIGANKDWYTQGSGIVTYSYDANKGLTVVNSVDGSMVLDYLDLTLFKPNTEYTLFIDVTWSGIGRAPMLMEITNQAIDLNNGLNIVKFTSVPDLTIPYMCFRLGYTGTVEVGCEYTFNNIMVLEGDWTNVDIHYFEGMQSVKMPVLKTTGKNLFNKNNIIVDGYILSNGTLVYETGDNRNAADFIEVEPNCIYRISGIKNSAINSARSHQYVGMYDKNKKFISSTTIYCLSDSATFTTTENTKYIRVSVRNDDINRLQIEKGATTPYEPHKSNILTCNEEVELRGIGDIKDELNLVTGELTQRIGEIVLDGSEKWSLNTFNQNNTECVIFSINIADKLNNYLYKCDKFIYTGLDVLSANNIEGIFTGGKPTSFFINVSKTKASTVEEFKNWLSNNNVTVQYQLIESVKTVDLSTLDQDGKETELSTFDDITHVTASSEGLILTGEITVATKNAADVIDASVMSLRMDDILNSQETLEGSANAQSDDIDVAMLGMTDIYEQLL